MNVNDDSLDAGTGEFDIGIGQENLSELGMIAKVEAEQAIEEARLGTLAAVAELRQQIADCITPCRSSVAECIDCLTGRINGELDFAGQTTQKSMTAVQLHAMGNLREAAAMLGAIAAENNISLPLGGGGGIDDGIDVIGSNPNSPTDDQCRLMPSLPGCFGNDGGGGGGGPTIIIDNPNGNGDSPPSGGGKCDGSNESYFQGKYLPIGQQGPPGWVIYNYLTEDCKVTFSPGAAKYAGWGPNEPQECGIQFPMPSTCPTNGGGGGGGDDTTQTGNDQKCIPICGITPQPDKICDLGPGDEPPPDDEDLPPGCVRQDDGSIVCCDEGELSEEQISQEAVDLVYNGEATAKQSKFTVSLPSSSDQGPAQFTVQPGQAPIGKGGGGGQCKVYPPGQFPTDDGSNNKATFQVFCDPATAAKIVKGDYYNTNFESNQLAYNVRNVDRYVDDAIRNMDGGGIIGKAIVWAGAKIGKVIVNMVHGLGQALYGIIPRPAGCDSVAMLVTIPLYMWGRLCSMIFGMCPPVFLRGLEQQVNVSCQTGILSSDVATNLHAKGFLTKDEYEACLKINGDCPPWFEKLKIGLLREPTWQDAFSLFRGGLIQEQRFRQILERNGIPKDVDLAEWEKVFDAIPQPPDLIRFMVRDVDNQQAVTQGKLDDGFEDNYKGKIKEWMDRQALTRDEAIRYWRAHWELPSPTALYNMLIRLRPGRGAKTPDGKPIEVNADQVRQVLKQNDMAPGWVDAMMALAYQPMTRVDLRRAYEMGAVNDEELKTRLGDLGYDPETTERMAEFYKRTSAAARADLTGGLTPKKAKQLYFDSLITKQDYQSLLESLGYDPQIIANTVNTVEKEREARDKKLAMQHIRSVYMGWRIDTAEYLNTLVTIGIERERAQELVDLDEYKRSNSNKHVALAKLCKFVKFGFISAQEYMVRAQRMGYSIEDAEKLAMTCQTEIAIQLQKEQERNVRAAAAAAARSQREQERREAKIRRAARERWPCKAAPKPTCPPGVEPPPLTTTEI